jgi:hypothetical protein
VQDKLLHHHKKDKEIKPLMGAPITDLLVVTLHPLLKHSLLRTPMQALVICVV